MLKSSACLTHWGAQDVLAHSQLASKQGHNKARKYSWGGMGGKIWKWRSTAVLHVCQEGGKIGNLENTTCSRIFEGKEGARTVSLHFPPTDLESFAEEVAVTRTEGSLRLSGLLKWTFFCLTWAFGQDWSHSLQIEIRYEVNLSLRLKSH